MTQAGLIRNAGLVEEVLGEWPSFHDAEVLSLRLDRAGPRGPTLEMDIHAFRPTAEVDACGTYVLKDHTLVKMRFLGVTLESLEGFNQQNVIWELLIEEVDPEGTKGARLDVHLDSSFGVEVSFQCEDAEVVAVAPYQPNVG